MSGAADTIDRLVREARAGRERKAAPPGGAPRAPSGPQLERAQPGRRGRNPWLVLGAAVVAGYALAKIVDWRGHAHPRL